MIRLAFTVLLAAALLTAFSDYGVAQAARSATPPTAPATTSGNTLVTVVEDKGTIIVRGSSAADGMLSRSFRLSTSRKAPLPLSFAPSDLRRDGDGATVDRGTVRVKDPIALGAAPQDYVIEISGLVRTGHFQGYLELRSSAAAGVVQKIPLEVFSERAIAPAIAAETPRFAVKRTTSCDLVMKSLGFAGLCAGEYQVALTGSKQLLAAASPSLLLVRSDGSAVPLGQASWVGAVDSGALVKLVVPDKALAPGHYAGRVRVDFGDRADAINIPVEIDVRWKPWWPLVALILGVLLGRWLGYMQRTGNSLIDSADRLSIIRARNERLPISLKSGHDAVTDMAGEIWNSIELGQAENAAASVGLLDRCMDVLERTGALNPTLADPGQKAKVDAIVLDVRALLPDDAGKKLVELKDLMAAAGGGAAGVAAVDAAEIWRKVRTVAVLSVSRPVQYVVLLLLLAGAGLKVFYVDGGATLGAEPIADILALVTWGLSADVMSRTISSASLAPAKK